MQTYFLLAEMSFWKVVYFIRRDLISQFFHGILERTSWHPDAVPPELVTETNCPLDGEEPLKGFDQGSDGNIFAILKGHFGSSLGKRLAQRAIKRVKTWESEHCCTYSG